MSDETALRQIFERLGSIDTRLDAGATRHAEFASELKMINSKIDKLPMIFDDDGKEIRADFHHLRRFRKSVERVQVVSLGTAITVAVTGVLAAFWLGLKWLLGK